MRVLAVACVPVVLAMCGLVAGCGDDGGSDAGVPGADGECACDGGLQVVAPDIAWLEDGRPPIAPPSWLPCPAGWREVAESDATYCEPYAMEGPLACGEGEAHFPGTAGCAPVGAACPTSDFAEGLPADAIRVLPGAAAGGDGSAAAPFAALSDVPWASLAAGSTVALGKGTHDGLLRPGPGVTVVGACARDTIVTGSVSPGSPLLSPIGAGATATVRDVTLADATSVAVLVRDGQSLSLEGAVIERMADAAVYGQGAGHTSLQRVAIRDAVAPVVAGALMRGVIAIRGAEIEVHEGTIERVFVASVYAQDAGSRIALTDVALTDTRGEPGTGMFGYGVIAQTGASISLTRALVRSSRAAAVLAQTSETSETSVQLQTVVVRDTLRPDRGVIQSNALVADMGATVDASQVLVDRHLEYAAIATQAGSSITLSDAILRGARASTASRSGRGLGANFGGSLIARRVLVTDFDGTGVFFANAGTTAVLEDVVIRDPAETGDGMGVAASEGAVLDATRLAIERVHASGLHLINPGTIVRLTDTVIRETASSLVGSSVGDQLFGDGVNAQEGALLEASRLLVEGSHRLGVAAFGAGTTLQASDLVVTDTQSQEADGTAGVGLHISLEATGAVRRARIERSHYAGTSVYGATLTMTDALIEGVVPETCGTGCGADAPAFGVTSVAGASVSLASFAIVDTGTCGVLVASAGGMDLSRGLVRGAEIGACLQVNGYDVDRLSRSVTYSDNGTNLDSTSLAVPDGLAALPPPDP